MLTEEQKQQILNSPNFKALINKPTQPTNTGSSFVERARQAREQATPLVAPTLPTQKKGFGERLIGRIEERGENIAKEFAEGGQVEGFNKKQSTADTVITAGLQAPLLITDTIFEGLVTAFRGAKKIGQILLPKSIEEKIGQKFEVTKEAFIEDVGEIAQGFNENIWNKLKEEKPEVASFLDKYVSGSGGKAERNRTVAEFASELVAFGTAKKSSKVVKEGVESLAEAGIDNTKRIIGETTDAVTGKVVKVGEQIKEAGRALKPKAETIEAIKQIAIETGERFPRVAERVVGAGEKAVDRAKRIRTSEPAVANAIKANLDDRIINTVSEADDATRKAYKQVLDIADESPTKIGTKKQTSIVSGDLISKQIDLIFERKRAVGKSIGEKVDKLLKTTKIDMTDGISQADEILSSQGITINKGKLDFAGSNFTPAERTKIKELYNLATEAGFNLSPSQVRGKDNLFSKLQREANMEGIGKILVDTGDGKQSLFSVFRDIFSNKLDTVSPEIRKLNKKYRDLILITDDIESSILKTPNLNVTKSTDPAEFAKVNMRRIFGESQSSPAFEAVADQIDKLSRTLGYKDATPKEIAEFAIELRKLYPDSIPKAGFQGGIAGGIKAGAIDAVSTLVKTGKPGLEDQRKALKELLESFTEKTKSSSEGLTDPTLIISEKQISKAKLPTKTTPLTKEIQKAKAEGKSFEEFVGKQLDDNSFITSKPITVYRGEGGGIGNNTLVNGKYFADSKEFASNFGKVSESTIPANTKIFNLDNVKHGGTDIVPEKLLVDSFGLSDYLIDNGFKYTKNTNVRGVEYVELKRGFKESIIANDLVRFKSLDSKFRDLAEKYKTVDAFATNVRKRVGKDGTTPAYKILKEYFQQVKSGKKPILPKTENLKLKQLWDKE